MALLAAACGRNSSEASATALWTSPFTGLDGQPATLRKYRDQPLIINFWARWCPPCLAEIPDFVATGARFRPQGAELVGIAIEDQAAPIADFVRDYRIDYPVLLPAGDGQLLMKALGNEQGALPFTVVLDRNGNIVARKLGRMSRTEMEAAFAAALQ